MILPRLSTPVSPRSNPGSTPIKDQAEQPAAAGGGATDTRGTKSSRRERRPLFRAPGADWLEALLFMLSMSLLGLKFYPALLIIVVFLVRSWRRDRYHFLMQLFLFCCVGPLVDQDLLYVKRDDLMILAGIVGLFVVNKRFPLLKKTLKGFAIFVVLILLIASRSSESFLVQIHMMRGFFSFVVITVPIMIFSDSTFRAGRVFKVFCVYYRIICGFYVADGALFRGWVLLPATYSTYAPSTFYKLVMMPTSLTYFPRKYPNGLLLLILMIYPLLCFYRFNWKQWTLVGLSMAISRTMTVIAGLVISFLLFVGRARKVVLSFIIAIAAFALIYAVDSSTGGGLRVASTVEQFALLKMMEDPEELADFGSGRMAQIIPKMEMLYDSGREWIGFGFIHQSLSKGDDFQLTNNLYSDISQSKENAAAVEETHIQTILYVGYLGFIIQTIFYVWLYFVLKPCRMRNMYLIALIAASICGFGGFAGLNAPVGLFIVAMAYAVVLLDNKRVIDDAKFNPLASKKL